jgi:threonine/homoserine/homoserine lactone efflux protein
VIELGQAIGDVLPFAVGVAISPIPIIAIIVMLLSARAGANSASFLAGWVVGVTGACIVLLALSGLLDTSSSGSPSDSSSVIKLVLGALLVMMALRNFRKRPKAGEQAELPKWLQSIDSLTPVKSAGLGVLLSAVNPKNLLLIAGAMVGVAQLDLPVGDEAAGVIVFVLIAISTVAAPVIVYRVAGERAQQVLDEMKVWLGQNNAVVMAVLLLVIGVVLLSKGISGLSA